MTDAIAGPLGRRFPAVTRAGEYVTKYLGAARMLVIGVGALVTLLWPHPTRGVIWITTLIALLVLFMAEIVARTAPNGTPGELSPQDLTSEPSAAQDTRT